MPEATRANLRRAIPSPGRAVAGDGRPRPASGRRGPARQPPGPRSWRSRSTAWRRRYSSASISPRAYRSASVISAGPLPAPLVAAGRSADWPCRRAAPGVLLPTLGGVGAAAPVAGGSSGGWCSHRRDDRACSPSFLHPTRTRPPLLPSSLAVSADEGGDVTLPPATAQDAPAQETADGYFSPLAPAKYVLLAIFKWGRTPMSTPAWVVVHGDRAYFQTWSTSRTCKRLRHNDWVQVAPCSPRGRGSRTETAPAQVVKAAATATARRPLPRWTALTSFRGGAAWRGAAAGHRGRSRDRPAIGRPRRSGSPPAPGTPPSSAAAAAATRRARC